MEDVEMVSNFHQLFSSTEFKRDLTLKVLLKEELSLQEKFVSRFSSKVVITKQPQFTSWCVENAKISSMIIAVDTRNFETYEEMCEFIDKNLNDNQMFVYLYHYEDDLHRLRYKFIDKNIKLYHNMDI